jgi:hypothetical protein
VARPGRASRSGELENMSRRDAIFFLDAKDGGVSGKRQENGM